MGSRLPVGQAAPAVMLILILMLTYFVYAPGLQGGFLFDDHPNLGEMGNYGGVVDFSTFKAFVFHGISSPLGRPLSLASFLLDSNTWPAEPYSFKLTNLKIHLLTGVFLCWATLNLMRLTGRDENQAAWIAILGSGVWLLHPYMVSTTFYVVQRMAQLSTLFSFIGLTAYLHGRIISLRGESWRGYLWMSISLALATPLAVLSKENGILLPLLVLVIEFCLAAKLVALNMWWRTIFLYAPSLVVLWLLLKEINFSNDAWPNRVFTQPERLLTEPRIIWEYLYYLWVPHVEGRGLFQDGYNFSRSLFSPISTLFSLVALTILVGVAAVYRNRYPLFSLGVFFFLAGHLLESTTIGLELYFEHRNYLPAAFLFLPVIVLIFDSKKVSRSLAVIIAVIVFALLSFFTWKRANLWANTEALQFYWAASTPESPRAQAKIVRRLMYAGRTDEGIERMENAVQLIPQSSLLTISLLIIKVHSYKASAVDFERAEKMMRSQSFDPQSVMGLRNLVEDVVTPDKLNLYGRNTLTLISELEKNSNFNKVHAFRRIAPYLKASLHMAFKEFDLAYKEYLNAIPLHHDADASLAMVAEMARANRPAEALQLLGVAYKEFEKQRDSTLVRSRESYNLDFQRLQSSLQADVQAMGGVSH